MLLIELSDDDGGDRDDYDDGGVVLFSCYGVR